jgi:hypothetical protein
VFDYESEEVKQAHHALIRATDGSEPCFDPHLTDGTVENSLYESPTDLWVEPWARGSNVSAEQAEALCAGCHVYEQCREYALKAKEPLGIWGGTRPIDRGIRPNWKG